jgi:hypothetical protein
MARISDRFVEGVGDDIVLHEGIRGPCMHNHSTSCVSPESAALCTAEGDRHFFGFDKIFAGVSFPNPTILFFNSFAIVFASFFFTVFPRS